MALSTPTPLEAAWESALAAALARRVEPRALALMLERLARRDQGPSFPLAPGDELAVRTLFCLPRDLPRIALPIAELALADALPPRPLRVLDLGTGPGATALGLARALPPGSTLAALTAVDPDPDALTLLRAVAREAAARALIPWQGTELVTLRRDVRRAGWDADLERYDLVTAGDLLGRLPRDLRDEKTRGDALAAVLAQALAHLAPDGALVVLEPAPRAEARALHHARDALLRAGATVFAPCPHARGCPMLDDPRTWCHEALPGVALPPWLDGVARSAGQLEADLAFAYLVLRRDGRTLAQRFARAGDEVPLRLVSRPRRSKGKTEVLACGDVGARTATRLMELHRDRSSPGGAVLDAMDRGDPVALARTAAARGATSGTVRLAPGELRGRHRA